MSHFLRIKNKSSFHCYVILLMAGWLMTSCGSSSEAEPNISTPTATQTKIATIEPSSTPTPLPTNTPIPTQTQAPTATPNGTATVEARLQTVSFSEENSEGNSAEDILDEIYFFGVGGGGPGCNQPSDKPYFSAWNHLSDEVLENNSFFFFATCNWPFEEEVTLEIIYPNGRKIIETFVIDYQVEEPEISSLQYRFESNILVDPPGNYTVRWVGNSHVLEQMFEIVQPDGARVYNNNDGSYFLYNFEPVEAVRVVALSADAETNVIGPHAIAPFQTNEDGRLLVNLDFEETIISIIVLGEVSGEVKPFFPYSNPPPASTSIYRPISDTGIQSCRFEHASNLSVTITKDLTYNSVQKGQTYNLTAGQTVIFDGSPKWLEVEGLPRTFGWHWLISTPGNEDGVYVWQEYFEECEALQ